MIVELDDLYLRLGQEIAALIAELSFTPDPKALPRGLSVVFARTPNDVFQLPWVTILPILFLVCVLALTGIDRVGVASGTRWFASRRCSQVDAHFHQIKKRRVIGLI